MFPFYIPNWVAFVFVNCLLPMIASYTIICMSRIALVGFFGPTTEGEYLGIGAMSSFTLV